MIAKDEGLREVIQGVVQEVLEAEMDDALGAGKWERTDARVGYRAGYYPRMGADGCDGMGAMGATLMGATFTIAPLG